MTGRFEPVREPLSYKIRHFVLRFFLRVAWVFLYSAEKLCMPDFSPTSIRHIRREVYAGFERGYRSKEKTDAGEC